MKNGYMIEFNDAVIEKGIIIDVRSQSEYKEDHIPNALNIPLLTDEDRAKIGIIYRNEGSEIAKMEGFKCFSKRYPAFIEAIKEATKKDKTIYIYCWRGGARSQYVLELIHQLGYARSFKIIGGYKKYRNYVTQELERIFAKHTPIVLHGYTGSGKTEIIERLKEKKIPTICLESLAQNAGSVFGNILFPGETPSQKKFESRLLTCMKACGGNYFFIESESKRVGNIYVPEPLFNAMKTGVHIFVKTPIEARVKNLYNAYLGTESNDTKIIEAVYKLKKRLGNEATEAIARAIKQGDIERAVKWLLESYYDPLYQYSIEKYQYSYFCKWENVQQVTEELSTLYSEIERESL